MASLKTRWLVIASGFFVGVANSAATGGAFAIFALIQIIGALLEIWFKNLGFGLMCFGSMWLSFLVFLFLLHPDSSVGFKVILLFSISTLLMIVSDAALLKEYLKIRKMRKTSDQ